MLVSAALSIGKWADWFFESISDDKWGWLPPPGSEQNTVDPNAVIANNKPFWELIAEAIASLFVPRGTGGGAGLLPEAHADTGNPVDAYSSPTLAQIITNWVNEQEEMRKRFLIELGVMQDTESAIEDQTEETKIGWETVADETRTVDERIAAFNEAADTNFQSLQEIVDSGFLDIYPWLQDHGRIYKSFRSGGKRGTMPYSPRPKRKR